MSAWDAYPLNYRQPEVSAILEAAAAGECVSVVGLSGAGKSNLLGFIAHRVKSPASSSAGEGHLFFLVDCNRLSDITADAFFRLIRASMGEDGEAADEYKSLNNCIVRALAGPGRQISLLLDRFDSLGLDDSASPPLPSALTLASNLRALRDAHKYALSLVTATRRPLFAHTELAELFYAHTIWLGPLNEADALWNINRFLTRRGLSWDQAAVNTLIEITRGYPSILNAACEAHASGCPLDAGSLAASPAVGRCLVEFWSDMPDAQALKLSGLEDHPLLKISQPGHLDRAIDSSQLTAKENLLLNYLRLHPNQVCEKDNIIQAVWPEDRIFEHGVRDDSLAQLVRRLREKIESDPSRPRCIQTIPGRGYRFLPFTP
jgi:hypothetical protein